MDPQGTPRLEIIYESIFLFEIIKEIKYVWQRDAKLQNYLQPISLKLRLLGIFQNIPTADCITHNIYEEMETIALQMLTERHNRAIMSGDAIGNIPECLE